MEQDCETGLKSYQTPELKKVGSVSELTKQPDDGISGDGVFV